MSEQKKTRCRFAPSPTGMLHVGGARTALFNYLFARSTGGSYVLRVEDSDRERSTEGALEAILQGLSWLGLSPDEDELYFQSKRTETYQKYARQLLASGDAYPCYATADELDQMRESQRAEGKKPRYDGRCRPAEKGAAEVDLPNGTQEKPYAIRIRMQEDGDIVFQDGILGEIRTPAEELDDFIIVRSDGTPTYNFVNAIDDIEMEITHVLRGNEHVANTPKQLCVYKAIGATPPIFAHFPLILGPDKKKLSKRHGATSVFEYRKDGYLPDAFINYLARLGWSAGDQEIFTRKELEQAFSLEGVGKSPSVFDVEKLRWVSSEHLKKLPTADLATVVATYVSELLDIDAEVATVTLKDPIAHKLIEALCERSKTLVEIAEGLSWLFLAEDISIDEKDRSKFFKESLAPAWSELIATLSKLNDFTAERVEKAFEQVLQAHELSFGKLGQPLRLALTGTRGGIPLFLMFEALGKDRSVHRLTHAQSWIS